MSIPFTEFVHPETGRKLRIAWDRDRAKAKSAEFRQEAIDHFRQRDLERARAAGVEVADDATILPTCSFTSDGSFTVDPIASKVKHAGSEVNDRWIPRWQEFCSVPQNEDGAEYAPVTYVPKSERNIAVAELPRMNLDEARDYAANQTNKIDKRTKAGRALRRGMANV